MKAHKDVILTADVMFVNGIPFFVTLSTNIRYFTAERLANRKKGTLISSIIKVAALYHHRGFQISVCHMDGEFECLREELLTRSFGILVNTCSPDEHVP